MRVILQEDVLGLGEEGDVCDVSAGYARNFLLRQRAAVPYSVQAVAQLAGRRDVIEKRKADKRANAAGLRERLESEILTFEMTAGDTGKLFGSITNVAIATELETRGFEIDRRRIEVPDHSLKTIGVHEVRLRLYESESATLKVVITGEGGSGLPASPAAEASLAPAEEQGADSGGAVVEHEQTVAASAPPAAE